MNEVRTEINNQLLAILKEVDSKIENPFSRIQMINSVAQVYSMVNK
ncbi:hypothetical protein [Bacillus norwichensis]|uniref:Uncharacterized protein n=1 Tax=Bacillus norwichensis TaxID=2762217 RepID=A0ABR8VM73_9BACI|nr:hypothetical protein [Bacillus norwichensis]MBD8005827.1 hypothetical protein [Bacillus norwichensis]